MILAAVASSLTLILYNLTLTQPNSKTTAILSDGGQSSVPANAFTAGNISASEWLNSVAKNRQTSPQNLTESVAESMAMELVKSNPEGPQNTDDGPGVIFPSESKLASAVSGNLAGFASQAKDQMPSFEEKVPRSGLLVVPDSGTQGITAYVDSINNVLERTVLTPEFEELLQESPSLDIVAMVGTTYKDAAENIKAIPVPESLVEIQRSLVALLTNREKFVDIAATSDDDPLKSLLVMQGTSLKIDQVLRRDAQNFEYELQKANSKIISQIEGSNKFLAALRGVLGINSAEAFIFVPTDCLGPACTTFHATETSNTLGSWLRVIWEWLQMLLTEKLKQTLVNLAQQKILGFVQGSGAPMFIQGWASMLTSAYTAAGNRAMQTRILPGLSSSFSTIVQQALGAPPPNLQSTINLVPNFNPTNFFNNLQSGGGWQAYASLLNNNNNMFGALLNAHDIQLAEAERAKEAALAKAQAAQGFKGKEVCNDGSPPNSDGTCWDGSEPIVTSPGKTTEQATQIGASAQIQRIVNANNLWGLLTGFATSMLTQLVNSGVSGIVSLTNTTTGSGSTFNNTTVCSGLTGQALTDCQSGTSNANQLNNSTTTQTTSGSVPTQASSTSPLTCSPGTQTVTTGQNANISATGGAGYYYWSATGGSPAVGFDTPFSVSFSSVGAHTVSVTSGGDTANCTVNVQAPTYTGQTGPCAGLTGQALYYCQQATGGIPTF